MASFHRFDEQEGASLDKLVEDEALQEFLDRMPGGLFRYKAEGEDVLDFVNTGLIEIFGCDTYKEFCEYTGNTFHGMILPEDREAVESQIAAQVSSDNRAHVVYRIRRTDGSIRWIDDSGKLVRDSKGIKWFYVNLTDITDHVEDKMRLKRANERLEILTALSNDVIFDIECATGYSDVYGDFVGRFGREPEQSDFVVHRRCQKECNLSITTHDLSELMEQISEKSLVDFDTSTVDSNGDPIWYRYQSVVLYDEDGEPVRHVGRLLDTHEMVVRESQFRKKAERDGLTGLFNRTAALDRIESMIQTEGLPCTLIAIDVDDFKGVNDTYGHPEGDRVLTELGRFLTQAMRKEDVVARMGGDEFVIFAPGLRTGTALTRILNHISRGPFAGSRSTDSGEPDILHEAAPSLSVGAACCLNPPITFEKLYSAADQALYKAKKAGKAGYELVVLE